MIFRVLLFFVSICAGSVSAQTTILIGAASDLKFALDSVISVYQQPTSRVQIRVSYGSSGKLFEQISNGAPYDLFFSADRGYPLKLKQKGKVISEVITYGYGRLVIWSKTGNPLDERGKLLLREDVRKIAIANPVHAPYGRAAEQALKSLKIYDQVRDKLVFGENISQAAQFVTSGAADAGILALSLALSPTMQNMGGSYYLIPEENHDPLEQAYVILEQAKGKKVVADFQAFLKTDTARQILSYFGFSAKP